MRELSLHLMDIIENSISAKAKLVRIEIVENTAKNLLSISVIDNGCGMNSEMVNRVTDPFVTSRTTRKVGLGLSLFKSACERCDGNLKITSIIGEETKVYAEMKLNHIDRAPIGKIYDTITTELLNDEVDIEYTHRVNDRSFIFDSREIKKIIGNDLNSPDILIWIKEYIRENIENIGGGV